MSKIDILGVKVDDLTFREAIDKIVLLTQDRKKSHYVVTVNPEFVMLARRNQQFGKILKEADLALADGVGVVWAKLIFGGKVHNRITGVDLVQKLCAKSGKRALRIGFLGGFDSVAEEVAKRQKAQNPHLKVVLADPGNPTISYDLRLKGAIDAIGRIDILFVAYGMGQQEFWIDRMKNRLNVGVFIGVGGAFDYLSTVKKRAPIYIQNLGLEWLWRIFREPTRIVRMSVLPVFVVVVIGQFLRKKLKFSL